MDFLSHVFLAIARAMSRLLEPAVGLLERLDFLLRQELTAIHAPSQWQGTIITVGWVIVIFVLFRTLQGFLRVVLVLLVALMLAKLYGVLPAPR